MQPKQVGLIADIDSTHYSELKKTATAMLRR
jgi:hypothetical protein